ncbi:MAG: ABC transporter substrate-binding protein [Hyphomicrobiales bacterium]
MRRTLIAAAAALLATTSLAVAGDTKIGALMDATGPIASFMPPLQNAVNLAIDQINAQGGLLDGKAVLVVGDTQGGAQTAVDAATKLVNVENVPVIMGAFMSGTTIAAANAVAIPAGVVMISPTATSPAITDLKDNDTMFRLVPSDNYQGSVLAKMVMDAGLKKVAVTYVNNDYGVGIGNTFIEAYKKLGGEITAAEKHEEKKNSYRSELATLAKGSPDALIVVAYAGDSGSTIVKQAIEGGLFTKFVGTDGLRDDALIKEVGAEALKDSFFSSPTSPADNAMQKKLHDLFNAAYKEGADKAFVDQTYDATFLAALAVEKAGSSDKTLIAKALREVASAPGEVVGPGEWQKAKDLIKAGKDINYEGAGGSYEFDANGDVTGYIGKFVVDGDKYKQVGIFQ